MLKMREESMASSGETASSSSALPPPATSGISVTRTFKVGDKLMMRYVVFCFVFVFLFFFEKFSQVYMHNLLFVVVKR